MELIEQILKIYQTKTAPFIAKETGVSLNVIKEITRGRTKTLKHADAEKIKAWLNGTEANQSDETNVSGLTQQHEKELAKQARLLNDLLIGVLDLEKRVSALEKK